MKLKKLTEGLMNIENIPFAQGKEVEVSEKLGKYITDTFGSMFEVTEAKKVAPKAPEKVQAKKEPKQK